MTAREAHSECRAIIFQQPDNPMFEQTFKNIDDILHKDAGCTSELDYTEYSSWLLFLKHLDAQEQDKAAETELEGMTCSFILAEPLRWESWAAPKIQNGAPDGKSTTTPPPPATTCAT